MACNEVEGKVAHLRGCTVVLPDLARRCASTWRSLRRRKERRLLGVIGLSSWVSGDGARVIWRHLALMRGLYYQPAVMRMNGNGGRGSAELFVRWFGAAGSIGRDARKVGEMLGVAVVAVGVDGRRWVRTGRGIVARPGGGPGC